MMSIISLIKCLIILGNFEVNAIATSNGYESNAVGSEQVARINRSENHNHLLNSKIPSQEIISPQDDSTEPNHCVAFVRTNDPNSKFFGASGAVSLYNPRVASGQWSASRMRLSNGDESIEVGWMVNQDLFKDSKTHLYIRYVAGGHSCINLDCPGFVHVGKAVHLGGHPDKISQRGYYFYIWRLYIEKHKDDGNWWVSIGPEKYQIGYWPKSLFTSLADVATQVEWGGEVYVTPDTKPNDLPFMGCGNKPDYDPTFAAYYKQTKLIDNNYRETDPPQGTVKVQNCREWYNVLDADYKGDEWGRLILFGGPGVSH